MNTRVEIKQDSRISSQSKQVLAIVCLTSLVIFILMSVCLISSYWITAEGFRQGLLYLCIEERSFSSDYYQDDASPLRYGPRSAQLTAQRPVLQLPFDLDKEDLKPGCYPNRNVAYLKLCTILCLITQLSAAVSAILAGLGARWKGVRRITCLRFAICTTLVMLLCDISVLVIYPNQFAKELDKSNRAVWELNSAFGLACGAAILALGSLILLVATFVRNSNVYESAPTRI